MNKTECTSKQLHFQELDKRKVVGEFNGGTITSDAGALLLREIDRTRDYIQSFADCFTDYRNQDYIEFSVEELLRQRIFGICLGYEDLNDHDELRTDPLLATACGRIDPLGRNRKYEQDKGKALSGKSTLNRIEGGAVIKGGDDRYKKITVDFEKIENFFIDTFIKSYSEPPKSITLDIDATDDPLHGHQQGRFFHGYYDEYCYLPLYIFCGTQIIWSKLKTANCDPGNEALPDIIKVIERIRSSWPEVEIILRGDSGFCREEIMAWCEKNNVFYLFGISRNNRLSQRIKEEMKQARKLFLQNGEAARIYKDFMYKTLKSWSRRRRVIGKAEYLPRGENQRFIVTNLPKREYPGQELYVKIYCARGDMENRIKEQQLYLFADKTSCTMIRSNQLRLYFSSVAYVFLNELRNYAPPESKTAKAQCETLRLKLLKIGAVVTVSVRRVFVNVSSAYPYKNIFTKILASIQQNQPLLC
jgi:hypothetical protein